MHPTLPAALLTITVAAPLTAEAPPADNPAELGTVHWGRNLQEGVDTARRTGRPVLLLFQEIPGCQGCVSFGAEPMSHPLLVEAIEDCFVPVAIHNNKPGYDETIRTQYDEPAWNYPVMRFLGADGKDILPRRDEVFSTHAVAGRLIAALEASDRPVPAYLRLAADETAKEGRERVVFTMYCFWEGESRLGALDGVVSARASWLDGHEAVEVEYLSGRLSFETLLAAAERAQCADAVYTTTGDQARQAAAGRLKVTQLAGAPRAAKASDHTYALNDSPARYLPLTPMQAMKINSALRLRQPFKEWLSPRQARLLRRVEEVLRANADALEGLERPDDVGALVAYEGRLKSRVADASGG